MDTTKRITATTLSQIVRERMAKEADGISAHKILAAILRDKWDGKKITRNIVKHFLAEYGEPDAIVTLEHIAGMTSLVIYHCKAYPGYSDRLSMFIGYSDRPSNPRIKGAFIGAYDAASFEESDICHGSAAEKRNQQRAALLVNKLQLKQLAKAIQSVRDNFAILDEHFTSLTMPDIYTFRDLTGVQRNR